MQPRSRTRCRDPPPPPPGGGRHRRRSPPPPSPRHQRRPPPPHRRSPDRPPPRRYEEVPVPGAEDRRKRADILLEAGRLAAHYLVAQGVIPDHLLRAREDPNHAIPEPPAPPPPPPPAPASEEDPRWRRPGGDWGRAPPKGGDEPRRSGWDRRSHSFDDRRKYDVDRAARRTRDYDEPKRPPMSRSYSHNDRRPSGDPRTRSRSRSRSRSRTRTRTYHHHGDATRRDSDGRRTGRDFLDHTKPAINLADGEMPRKPKVPSSVVVAEVNGSAGPPGAIEHGEMESEMVGLEQAQDVSEEEDGEFAEDVSEQEDGEFAQDVSEEEEEEEGEEEEGDTEFAAAGFNDEDGAQMDATESQLSDADVQPPESVQMHSQLMESVEEEFEAGDASMAEPLVEKDGSFEVEAAVDGDGQELPAWYRIFDLNVIETEEGCEMTQISGDPPAGHVCDSVPDSAGQIKQQTDYSSSETLGRDEHARSNHLLEYGHDVSKYDLNNVADEHAQGDTLNTQGQDEDSGDNHLLVDEHDSNNCDLNHEADPHAQDNHLLSNEEIRLNHGMSENGSDSCCLSNEQMLLKQNADEQDHDNHQMETEQMPLDQGTSEQGLDTYHVSNEQFTLSHVTDEQAVNEHQLEPEPMHLPMGVHNIGRYNLNNDQMLLSNGTNKNAQEDACHLKDGETLLDQAMDGQARFHNMGNGPTVPVIDLEDDYQQQPDTRDTGKFLESISDQETSSFPDNPVTNIQAVSSSSITPNFGNRCTGRGAANSQVIPGDDDGLLYGAFDKMPLEVINVWDLPSSELGKSS